MKETGKGHVSPAPLQANLVGRFSSVSGTNRQNQVKTMVAYAKIVWKIVKGGPGRFSSIKDSQIQRDPLSNTFRWVSPNFHVAWYRSLIFDPLKLGKGHFTSNYLSTISHHWSRDTMWCLNSYPSDLIQYFLCILSSFSCTIKESHDKQQYKKPDPMPRTRHGGLQEDAKDWRMGVCRCGQLTQFMTPQVLHTLQLSCTTLNNTRNYPLNFITWPISCCVTEAVSPLYDVPMSFHIWYCAQYSYDSIDASYTICASMHGKYKPKGRIHSA